MWVGERWNSIDHRRTLRIRMRPHARPRDPRTDLEPISVRPTLHPPQFLQNLVRLFLKLDSAFFAIFAVTRDLYTTMSAILGTRSGLFHDRSSVASYNLRHPSRRARTCSLPTHEDHGTSNYGEYGYDQHDRGKGI